MKQQCEICKQKFSKDSLRKLDFLRDSLFAFFVQEYKELTRESLICEDDYKNTKFKYLYTIIQQDYGKVTDLEHEVLESLHKNELLTENTNEAFFDNLSLGERIADVVSTFGGSWKFIIIFFVFLMGWMAFNSYVLLTKSYDPFPYILLNLILSSLAAFQAPIIMMSQNRRAERDHIQAENDYKVNLKSELQIRQLNAKVDTFVNVQWSRLVEIQQLQTEILSDLQKDKPMK